MVYRLKLMFEWGGGCLWCDDGPTRDARGVGSVEDGLPLSVDLRERLDDLSRRHDTALNWDYPPDPGPWSAGDYAAFDTAAVEMLEHLGRELGPEFSIRYQPLG